MIEYRRDGDRAIFKFTCPGCGAEGDLGIDVADGMQSFECPEGCGSMFVPWQPVKARAELHLKCVVQAVSRD